VTVQGQMVWFSHVPTIYPRQCPTIRVPELQALLERAWHTAPFRPRGSRRMKELQRAIRRHVALLAAGNAE
jgi:hypothetical protein